MTLRHDGRLPNQLRRVTIQRSFTHSSPGSVLICAGRTTVLCTASVSHQVPEWLSAQGKGWVTAEYNMLPGSTSPRKVRERGVRIDGRTTEIQRLIGRSLRAIVDLRALGERTVTVDCDVLEADGGTRTVSITGGFIALVDALRSVQPPLDLSRVVLDSVAAVSTGLVKGQVIVDLDYEEDFAASVDMNVVMTGRGRYVEVQGTAEEATFDHQQLTELLQSAQQALQTLRDYQRQTLGDDWVEG